MELSDSTADSIADILNTAREWQDAGKGVAMCTVVNTWGSSPRPTGSQLLVDDEGQFIGSVSGGCIEGAVIREALQVIESGAPKKLEFGVSDQEAWNVGLACGGKVEVWVEKVED
ncbi:MAG: xanthine/CO dehydrogenase XdhC/CoxF family maturation factor [Gammaproteobacteria bacterium]|jgi:xanthine/CO dehydrogenase XdhC/CoxF family maturation factor